MKAINVEIKENGNQTIVFLKDKVLKIATREENIVKVVYWAGIVSGWWSFECSIDSQEYKRWREGIEIYKNVYSKTRPEEIRKVYREMKGRQYESGLKEYQIN